MGKVKYQKRYQLNPGSFKEKPALFAKQPCSKEKKELLASHYQRRSAITPSDISFHHKFGNSNRKNLSLYQSASKVQDNLLVPKPSKRARKRLLAKKKMAGAFANMDSLADALPAVEEESQNRSVKEKPRLNKSLKTKEMEMIKNIQWYQGAVLDPSFQADPWQACANYVNLMLMNEQKEAS